MNPFITFGTSHWAALGFIIIGAYLMIRYMRSEAVEKQKRIVRYTLGYLLILSVLMDPALIFIRWGTGAQGQEAFWNSALPFYLCDIVSICAAIALFTKNRILTEITYFWGMAGTTQGLITPVLCYNWDTPEYYNFFLQHGGVPIAAVTLVWGLRIYPAKGALKRIIIWSWCYMGITIGINYLISQNYGFLNKKPNFPTMLDYMGPYPYYLLTLQAIAFAMYWLLLKIIPKEDEIKNT